MCTCDSSADLGKASQCGLQRPEFGTVTSEPAAQVIETRSALHVEPASLPEQLSLHP